MSDPKPLILIDGSNWLFRAYHALPPLANAQGQPTGAIYGMGNMLRKLMKDYAPECIAVVFDVGSYTFRNDLYAAYKANRSETPEDLSAQFPALVEMIAALGLPVLQVPDVEADDVIGTLTVQAQARGTEVLIVTGDKDMAQLVGPGVALLDTMKNRRMDPAGVVERFGVPPHCIVDFLALMGDSSDNIPGVPGIGEKTAAKLLNEFGSLDGVIAGAVQIKGKLGENLRAHLHQLPLAKTLATIRCDLELPFALDKLRLGPADTARLRTLYQQLGFNRWAEELSAEPSQTVGRVSPASSGATRQPDSDEAPPLPAADLPPSPPTQVTTVLDWPAFDALLAQLETAALVCLDTETDRLDSNQARLVGLAFAVEPGHGWYVPVEHDYLGAPAQLPLAEVLARLKPLLEDPARPKLGQHLKYDMNVLARHGIHVAGVAYDTMLESYVLDATGNRHDMDTLAQKYLGHRTIHFEDVAGKGKSQISFNQVAIEQAAPYSAEDADITLRLHRVLYPQVAQMPPLLEVFERIEMPLLPVLAQMEQTGVKVDVPLLRRISGELATRMDELCAEATRVAGGEFNLGSPKQLQTILYEKLQLPVLSKTPKGDPSTAEDVLEELAAQHPLPRLILDWRGMQKLRSTYAEQLPLAVNPHTGRIHTSYHQAVAATGRLSSADPNLQNIPIRTAEGRRIRQAFIADEGHALLAIDYSQIELRLMAHFSADTKLVEAFHAGLDIHQATASEVFGIPLDEVPGDRRRAAKAINFGLIYGISAFGLARQLGIPRAEAQEYMDRFFGRYPGVKRFMDGTREQARTRGYVETLFGRRLYLPNIRSRNQNLRSYAERIAINAPLQGTAADLIKLAMIDVHGWLAAEAPELRMIMQVHDELVFEGPVEALEALAEAIATRMCRVTSLSVPLVADFGMGADWDRSHNGKGRATG